MSGSGWRLISIISTKGKSQEQLKAEARQAYQKLAQRPRARVILEPGSRISG